MMTGRGKAAYLLATISGLSIAVVGGANPAEAQTVGNPAYQTFFKNTVCTVPDKVPLFLDRCLETVEDDGSFADISVESQSSLNPTQVTVSASNALANARALADVTEAKLEALRDEEAGKPGADNGKIAGFGPWSVFANISGEWFDQSRPDFDRNERGFAGDIYGGTLGADYRLAGGARIGLMVSYSKYKLTFDAEPSSANFVTAPNAGGHKSETISVTAFAAANLAENVWLDAAAGYGWSDNDFRRNAVFRADTPADRQPNVAVATTGSAKGRQWFMTVGLGYDFASGPLSIGPYLRGRYSHSHINGYEEKESGAATGLIMDISEQEAESLAGIIGARASYAISASWGVIVPQGRLEFEHEFEDDARTTITRFALDPNGVPLPVTSAAPDRNHFNAGLSLSFILPNGVIPYIDYEALLGYSDFTRHRVSAGLRLEF